MATLYPTALDTINEPPATDPLSNNHHPHHVNLGDAIEAIEGELGLLPKGSYATVRARLDDGVYKTGAQTIGGDKTFSGQIINQGGLWSPWYEIGNTSSATTPYIDWHSSGTSADYDYRFIATGGSATAGRGYMQMTGANLVITGTLTSVTPFIVDAIFGQAANIQEWRVNGSILAAIHADGTIHTPVITDPGGSGPYIAMNTNSTIVLNRTTVGNVVLAVRGMSGQTGHLQQWQDNAGSPVASMDAAGVIRVSAIAKTSNLGPYINFDADAIRLYNRTAATNVPLVITGMAAQSAELTLWQNSSNATIASVNNGGGFMTRGTDGLRIAPAGGYGVIYRNDGTNMYTLLTNSGSPDGGWNSLRPMYIVLATGRVKMEAGLDVTGGLTSGAQAVATTTDINAMDARVDILENGGVYAGNLLLNSSFEQWDSGDTQASNWNNFWKSGSPVTAKDTSVFYNGQASWKITISSTADLQRIGSNEFRVNPGDYIVIRYRMRASTLTARHDVQLLTNDAANAPDIFATGLVSQGSAAMYSGVINTWEEKVVGFTVGANQTRARVYWNFQPDTAGTHNYWLDAASAVVPGPPPSTPWTAYTPTLTNINATVTEARYTQVGKQVTVSGVLTLTGNVSGSVSISLPVNMRANTGGMTRALGNIVGLRQGVAYQHGAVVCPPSGTSTVVFMSHGGGAQWGSSIPVTWATGDIWGFTFTYEIA